MEKLWNLRDKENFQKIIELHNNWSEYNKDKLSSTELLPKDRFLLWQNLIFTEEYRKLFYDEESMKDIFDYAKILEGKTFYDILANNTFQDLKNIYDKSRNKGGLGGLVEEHYFYYKTNNNPEPDFPIAGVEVKVTPYETITKKGVKKNRAGERLVIKMIPNNKKIESDFDKSELLRKMKNLLFIFYLRDKTLKKTEYKIDYVKMFSILSEVCKEDLEIISGDYRKIADKIIAGKAHELSEADTRYLGACTKGVDSKSLRSQYYNPTVLTKSRAFSLKKGYVTFLFNKYISIDKVEYVSILEKGNITIDNFEEGIIKEINKYRGRTEEEIYDEFGINKKAKNRNSLALSKVLGLKGDRIAEFEKANIRIKTIRVNREGMPREHMVLMQGKIGEMVEEDFKDSALYDYFEETRFLLVVFQEGEDGKCLLRGAKFWNMPITELETLGLKDWTKYKNKFIEGVKFNYDGYRMNNDLPKPSETNIFHMRPHAKNTSYVIDGKEYGKGQESDMDKLPNGDKMTKQSFWISRFYVAGIIKSVL